MIENVAGWIAPAATMIAAIMTAANLGARVTGWGFVVFAIGAVAWIVVGAATGQQTLLLSNAFLLIVDLLGIWRWLGRRAKFGDVAQAEAARSARAPKPDLFAVSGIDGMAVNDRRGRTVAHAVDALAECSGGRIDHLIVRTGGIAGVGEELRRLPWRQARVRRDAIVTDLDEAGFAQLPRAEAQ